MTPRYLFITVSDSSPRSQANLRALFSGIARQGVAGDMIVVNRGHATALQPLSRDVEVHALPVAERMSLSKARNAGLRFARENRLLDRCDIVAFPDDDATYGRGLLARVEDCLSSGSEIVSGLYAPAPTEVDTRRFPRRPRRLTPQVVMRVASSNTLFLSAAVVRALGEFDERLGLGAAYGAGEDSDYALRALAAGFRGLYDPSIVVQHPYKPGRPAQYYGGNVAVLAKHAKRGGTRALLARRLATGLLLTLQGRLEPPQYARLIRSACAFVARG